MQACLLRALASAGGLLLASHAVAADIYSPMTPQVQQTTTESGWTFTVAPYFWAADLSGDVKVSRLPQVHVDASFSDILKHLDFAAMGMGEARYDRYSMFTDLMYTKISGERATRRGILADRIELSAELFAGLLGAGYSIYEDSAARLDLAAGLRVWSVRNEISVSGGFFDGRSRTDNATWVDGLAGVRGTYSLTPQIYLTGWGFVGAGGADIDWDVAAAAGYRFNDSVSVTAGYRALGVNYSRNDFVFDVVQQGPTLGLAIKF